MSHFYGTVQGNRGEASRAGSKRSGMTTYCASWNGAVRCYAYTNEEGIDCVIVMLMPWHGQGVYPNKVLYRGPIGEYAPVEEA